MAEITNQNFNLVGHMALEDENIMNFMFALCINNIKHFIVQLMHINYKSLDY